CCDQAAGDNTAQCWIRYRVNARLCPTESSPCAIGCREYQSVRSSRRDESVAGYNPARSTGKVRRLLRGRLLAASVEFSSSDRKSTRLNSSHVSISYAVFCLKK